MKISYFFVSLIALSVASSSIDNAVARPSKSYARSTSSSTSYGSRTSTPSYTKSSGGYGASSSVSRSPSTSGGFWGMSRSQRTAAAAVAGAGAVAYATHKADASTTNTSSSASNSQPNVSTPDVATHRTYTQPAYQYPSTRTVVPVPVPTPSVPTRNITVNHYHNDNSDSYTQGVVAGAIMSNMNHEREAPQVVINNAPAVQPVAPVVPSVPTSTVVQHPPVVYNNEEHHSHWFMFLVVLLILGGGIAGGLWFLKKKQTLTGHSGSDLFDEMTEKKDNKMSDVHGNKNMPNLMIGNSISLSPIDVMNDPSASEDKALHFEPASTGKMTIVAIGESAKKDSVDVFTAYGDEDIDFFRLGVNGTSIEDAIFYSLIDVVFSSNEGEWDEWMNDTSGMLGSASFMTKDNVTWSRSLFSDSVNRMAPADIKEVITTKDGKETKSYAECEYERSTGFGSSFAQKENLLVRQMTDNDGNARIEIFAGVPVSPASLGFKLT